VESNKCKISGMVFCKLSAILMSGINSW
jgi:hypothetical protein